ncbi:MAG: VCBS repeat-containing protein [Rhodomicrobium sp.]|nr:VCBS repeat-containing protein [Rhodomicrobium sp.]
MISPNLGLRILSRLLCLLAVWLTAGASSAKEWHAKVVPAPGRVAAVEIQGADVRVRIGQSWYRFAADRAQLEPASRPDRPAAPSGALPDARVAAGRTIASAWLAEPTSRYDHGVLGDAIEAGSLIIELRDGRRSVLTLPKEAVFEDIEPRIVELDRAERIVLVKSYLNRGSALAIIDPESAAIIAETPPIGHPHAWLNPAGAADFNGDGITEIVFVRQPHVLGQLELWSWREGKLQKAAAIPGVSNHFIGSRALGMSFVADFDGDGHPDLAVPGRDRKALRLIGFAPEAHDIARVPLPARVATNIGAIKLGDHLALAAGLDNGQLILIEEEH